MSRLSELISKETLQKALSEALQYGGEFAEVYAQDSSQTSLSLQENDIRSAEFRSTLGVGIRVIIGEQTGYAYTDVLTPESLFEAARIAGRIAQAGGNQNLPAFRVISSPSYYKPERSDEIDAVQKAKLLERANKSARDMDPRIIEVQGSYVDDFKSILIANSEGLYVEDDQPMVRMMIQAMAGEDGRVHDGMFGAGARMGLSLFDERTPEELGKEAARQAVLQLSACEAPAGAMPVVVSNGWGGVLLHEAIGHGLEADFNRKGTSLYTGRIGEMVANEICTVLDDGTINEKRGTINVDDEGTPSGCNTLIEKGRLVKYMNDRLNAKLLGVPLTGNGRRQNYQFSPIPRMTNTFMASGNDDPQDILRSVDKGLYARVLGGGQVDITNGNFVFNVTEAYMIENGRITTPVRGANLIGSGPDILTKVSMVGNDSALDPGIGTCGKDGQWVPVCVGMPTVLISEMTVGGTAIG